jgi:O-antigen ligase
LVLALTACTIYLFHYGSQIGRFKKNGILLLIANIIFLIIATKTRNAWLAAFVLFAIYGFLRNRRLLIVLLLLGTCSLALPPVQERVRDLFCNQQERTYRGVNSWDWRIEMWKSSFTMIKERPVFGYGLTTFVPYSSKFSNNVNMGAHNVYIELLFESGIGGMLSSFILYCVAAFWFFRRMKIEHNLLFSKVLCISGAYVTSYILVSMADNMLYYLVLNWYVWFFIGLMMQGQLLREKEIS